MNLNNKNKYMPPKISLEYIREQEQNFIKSYEFWSKNISERAEKLDALLKSEDSNFAEVEKIQEDICKWQSRGEFEQKQLDKFSKMKSEFLTAVLISGAIGMFDKKHYNS